MIYYVYALLDTRKEKGIYTFGKFSFDYPPFYIGKGKKKRVYYHLKSEDNNKLKTSIIKKIKIMGKPYLFSFIKKELSEKMAFKLEKNVIKTIGRRDLKNGILSNLTNGGEGGAGLKSKTKGKTYEEIYGIELGTKYKNLRIGIKNGNYQGKANSTSGLIKFTEYRTGKNYEEIYGYEKSKKIKNKISNSLKGRILSKETIEKLRIKISGKNHYSQKDGYINKRKGTKMSASQKEKIKKSLKNSNKTIKGKTYEEFYGFEKSKLIKKIKSEKISGKNNPNYTIFQIKDLSSGKIIFETDKHSIFRKNKNKFKENKNLIILKNKVNLKKIEKTMLN